MTNNRSFAASVMATTLGRTLEIVEEFFAISVERRVTHPSVVAITEAARDRLFVTSDPA